MRPVFADTWISLVTFGNFQALGRTRFYSELFFFFSQHQSLVVIFPNLATCAEMGCFPVHHGILTKRTHIFRAFMYKKYLADAFLNYRDMRRYQEYYNFAHEEFEGNIGSDLTYISLRNSYNASISTNRKGFKLLKSRM